MPAKALKKNARQPGSRSTQYSIHDALSRVRRAPGKKQPNGVTMIPKILKMMLTLLLVDKSKISKNRKRFSPALEHRYRESLLCL